MLTKNVFSFNVDTKSIRLTFYLNSKKVIFINTSRSYLVNIKQIIGYLT